MADNFIVTGLPNYVEQNQAPLLRKMVLGGKTINRIGKQLGIKTSAALNYLETSPTFQEGKGCGFTPQGSATLSQRTITTGMIKVNMTICPDTLLGKYAEHLVEIGAGKEKLPFEQEVAESIVNNIDTKMEKAIWQGDTASLDADLQHFDGLLKIIGAEDNAVKVTVSGTSAYDAIKSIVKKIPANTLKKGAEIYVAPDMFLNFMLELVEKNYFHYSAGEGAMPEEFPFPATNIKVVSTEGLAGAGKMVAAYPQELFFGTDLMDNKEELKLWFSDDDDLFKMKAKWNAGTQVAFPDEVVLATIK
jgi:hypothetical protein